MIQTSAHKFRGKFRALWSNKAEFANVSLYIPPRRLLTDQRHCMMRFPQTLFDVKAEIIGRRSRKENL